MRFFYSGLLVIFLAMLVPALLIAARVTGPVALPYRGEAILQYAEQFGEVNYPVEQH